MNEIQDREQQRTTDRVVTRITPPRGGKIERRAFVTFTEHKPRRKKQYRAKVGRDGVAEVDLPPGEYSVQAWAEGFGVARDVIEVEAGKRPTLDLQLPSAPGAWRRPLKERLADYTDEIRVEDLPDLTLERGEGLSLDRGSRHPGLHTLRATSVDDLKRWAGARDDAFGHERPRFGKLPASAAELTRTRKTKAEIDSVPAQHREDLAQIAHEYIHGNSASVKEYRAVLNDYIGKIYPAGLSITAVLLKIVTIGPNATLTMAPNSVLFADILRIHATGKLNLRENCKVDVGEYQEFT